MENPNSTSTTGCRWSKIIRVSSLISSCPVTRYRSRLRGETQINQIIAHPLISPTATFLFLLHYWQIMPFGHITPVTVKIVFVPPNTMFLVVCVCDFYPDCTKCTHLFEINYHCICTQFLIYCFCLIYSM